MNQRNMALLESNDAYFEPNAGCFKPDTPSLNADIAQHEIRHEALHEQMHSAVATMQRCLSNISAMDIINGSGSGTKINMRQANAPWLTFLDTDTPLLERLQAAAAKLLEAVDNALLGDRQSAERCADQASVMLRKHSSMHNTAAISIAAYALPLAENRGATKISAPAKTQPTTQTINIPPPLIRGGLAPWQVRQITAYIDLNLGTSVSTAELAKVARLSPCHFSRAFRESFGASPHKYVMRKRIERAQCLMLTTGESLGQIAIECGLADQAHLCKLFQKIAGESPGMWRRARTTQPA
jgi:AraC-like DNA-binding protein